MKNKKIIITLIGIIMVVIFAFKGMQIYKAIQIKNILSHTILLLKGGA